MILIAIAKVYNSLLLKRYLTWSWEILREKAIHSLSDSDYSSNNWKIMCQKYWGNTIVCRFFLSIWFHTKRKNWTNTSSICSPQRNSSCQMMFYKNMKAVVYSLESCKEIHQHQIYNLHRSCTMNIKRSMERKWPHTKEKNKKQLISCWNYHGCRLCRWSITSQKYTCLSQMSSALAWTGSN